MCSTPSLLAVGSSCGAIYVYRAQGMKLLSVIQPTSSMEVKEGSRGRREESSGIPGIPPQNHKLPRFAAGGKVKAKAAQKHVTDSCDFTPGPGPPSEGSGPGSYAVVKMEFICEGRALLSVHRNGLIKTTSTDYSTDSVRTGHLGGNIERGRDPTAPLSTVVCPPSTREDREREGLGQGQGQGQGVGSTSALSVPLIATCSDIIPEGTVFAVIRGESLRVYGVFIPHSPASNDNGESHLLPYTVLKRSNTYLPNCH